MDKVVTFFVDVYDGARHIYDITIKKISLETIVNEVDKLFTSLTDVTDVISNIVQEIDSLIIEQSETSENFLNAIKNIGKELSTDINNEIIKLTLNIAGNIQTPFLDHEYTLENYKNTRWVTNIPDRMKLAELTVPGTHDSSASKDKMGRTQDLNIAEQLSSGIRFFDIRVTNSKTSQYDFELRHGPTLLGDFHENVIKPINQFLENNPKEVVFMSIMKEVGTFDDYLLFNLIDGKNIDDSLRTAELDIVKLKKSFMGAKSRFYQNKITPETTLANVRGKIIFVNRLDNDRSIGLHSRSPYIHFPGADDYNLECDEEDNPQIGKELGICLSYDYTKQWEQKVKLYLDQSLWTSGQFNINSMSASYFGLGYDMNARRLNKKLLNYLNNDSYGVLSSIIIMDFPTRTHGLIDKIIERNKLMINLY